MRRITEEYNVYKFEELSEEVKEKVKQEYMEDCGYDDNSEGFNSIAYDLLRLLGFDNVNLRYSLEYCQGDGVSFEFEINVEQLLDMLKRFKYNEVKEKGFEFLTDITSEAHLIFRDFEIKEKLIKDIMYNGVKCVSSNSRYVHKYTTDIVVDDDCNETTEDEEVYINSLEELLEKVVHTICDKLEDLGYEAIYYIMDDEEFVELSDSNEWEYLEDGTIF